MTTFLTNRYIVVHVLYSTLYPPLNDQQFKDYLILLPPGVQKQICQYKKWQDAQAALYGKILLRAGLIKYYQAKNTILDNLCYTTNGRPFLVEPKLDFNISHAGRYVICVISRKAAVGVDVEEIRPVNTVEYREHFSEGEFSNIQFSEDSGLTFFNYWVKKEAVAKAAGTGLSMPIQQINFDQQEGEIEFLARKWYLHEIFLDKGHCCWLATDTRVEDKLLAKEACLLNSMQTPEWLKIP